MRAASFNVKPRFACSGLLIFFFITLARAQDLQFFFDANGNLFVQTAATSTPPQIIGQPQNRIVQPGEATSFFVVATDTRALTYQWRFNGTNIGGATNDALLRQNVSTNNEGEYRVVLTNPSGSVTSAPALLMIDSDGDGIGDSWERTYFTNLNQNATADFDGDGASNLQEFLDGTDPTNSTSVRFRVLVVRDGGSVTKTPDLPSYTNGQTVTLTATASTNETFHAWIGDIFTRSNPVTLVMTNNKTVYARFTRIDFTWTNLASGDWDVAANWTPNLAPGSNDNVLITSSVSVTLNTPADCADVTLGSVGGSPTLTGSGTLTVRGSFVWTSGAMSGSGRTVIEAGATMLAASPGGVTLTTRTLENGGTALWTGAGNINLFAGAVITNRAGALFHAQNAANLSVSGGSSFGRFDNAGTFRKSGNTGTTSTGDGIIGFNNFGTVDIQAGALDLSGGGTHSGSFIVPVGAALRLSGGTHSSIASSSITGEGQFTVGGGATANLGGLVNVSGSNTFSGLVNFTGNTICTNNSLTISGGTANFNGTGSVSPAFLNLNNGTLGGTATVTVMSAMNWTNGFMNGAGRLVIGPGATLQMSDGLFLNGHTLENGGTTLWTGAGSFVMNPPAVITNRAGALFEVQNALPIIQNNGLCRFDNAGTFRKSVNPGTTSIPSFNNSGTVDIRIGILAMDVSYVSSPNALLNCALGGTTPGTGYGQLQVGGAVTLNGALSVNLINGFVPKTNDAFTVVTAGTRNGAFANFLYPSNVVSMELTNTSTFVAVRSTGLTGPSFITSSQLPDAVRFSGYTQQVVAVAKSLPILFGLSSGLLPAGLTLSSGGLISGTPTVAETNTFAVLITDGSGNTNQQTFSLRVVAPVSAPAGLISWWRAERDALDSSGTNHGATLNGATYGSGLVGQAFALDGVDDYISIPDSPTLRPASVTLEAWVKFFATNGIRIVMVKPLGDNTTFDSYGLALQDGTVIAAICDNSGFGPFLSNPSITLTGQWYHLAFTFDDVSKQQALYVNGIQVASGAVNKTMNFDNHPLLIGADLENGVLSLFHNGLIDEPSIYNRALTADEITGIYNAGAAGKQASAGIPAPLLLTPEFAGGEIKLTWTAVPNTTYRLEFTPDLRVSHWTALTGDVISVSNTASKAETLTTSNRFYRVRIMQ